MGGNSQKSLFIFDLFTFCFFCLFGGHGTKGKLPNEIRFWKLGIERRGKESGVEKRGEEAYRMPSVAAGIGVVCLVSKGEPSRPRFGLRRTSVGAPGPILKHASKHTSKQAFKHACKPACMQASVQACMRASVQACKRASVHASMPMCKQAVKQRRKYVCKEMRSRTCATF